MVDKCRASRVVDKETVPLTSRERPSVAYSWQGEHSADKHRTPKPKHEDEYCFVVVDRMSIGGVRAIDAAACNRRSMDGDKGRRRPCRSMMPLGTTDSRYDTA